MENINSHIDLKAAIRSLEASHEMQGQRLKEQYELAFEKMKPLNLIKNTFKEMGASSTIKDELMNAALGLATGYLSKKIIVGSTHNPLKKLLGAVLETAIATATATNGDQLRKAGLSLFTHIFNKRSSRTSDHE
jgi:hypothetical protein